MNCLLGKQYELRKEIRAYLAKNKIKVIKEFDVKIPANIKNNMSGVSLSAWIQVNASKILMAKNVIECDELKNMVKEYILLNQQCELENSKIETHI